LWKENIYGYKERESCTYELKSSVENQKEHHRRGTVNPVLETAGEQDTNLGEDGE
jgi:hypothetical protein